MPTLPFITSETAVHGRAQAQKAWAAEGHVWLALADGRLVGFPAERYPRLRHATPAELAAVQLAYENTTLRWENLDEDILIQHVLEGRFPE